MDPNAFIHEQNQQQQLGYGKFAEQHWVTVALRKNPHWNELKSSNSFWPELCCAISCPWYMIGRVWEKAKLPYPGAAAGGAFILGIPIITLEIWAESLAPNAQVTGLFIGNIVLAIICNVCLIGMVVYLRGKAREVLQIEGSKASDCCITVPWMCCLPFPFQGPALELSSMDRALTPLNVPRATPIPRTAEGMAVNSMWGTKLFGCDIFHLNGDMPQYCCALSCPAFMHLRLLYRMQLNSVLVFASILAMLLLPSFIMLVISFATIQSSPRTSFALRQLAWTFWIYNPTMTLVSAWVRGAVRTRYGIHGTVTDDICLSLCCQPCALAQMERETIHEAVDMVQQQEGLEDNDGNGNGNTGNNGTNTYGAYGTRGGGGGEGVVMPVYYNTNSNNTQHGSKGYDTANGNSNPFNYDSNNPTTTTSSSSSSSITNNSGNVFSSGVAKENNAVTTSIMFE